MSGPSQPPDDGRRKGALLTLAMLLAPLLLAAVRFGDYLRGGVFYFRDTGYFFLPWRAVFSRTVLAGSFPFWNDWMSNGRAFAANPNAAVFWPLTPSVLAIGFTGLGLLNIAAALLLLVLALRMLGASRLAAASGATIYLFSGVFQTLPTLFSPIAAAAPLPVALAALWGIGRTDGPALRRRIAIVAAAFGLSALGGEPAVTAIGVSGGLVLFLSGEERQPRAAALRHGLAAVAAALVLGLGLAAVQVVPAAGELERSARGQRMRPEEGALYWSVRPARALTLLEPRLIGDPHAERNEAYWGAGTFDAGNPYYYDLALGLLPLLLAIAAAADRRGRVLLALAALSALLATGRHLPGFTALAPVFSVFRYPEKWWLLATLALSLAAAVGIDTLWAEAAKGRAARLLQAAALASGALLGGGAMLAWLAPSALRGFLWSAGLGAGETPAAVVGTLLGPPLFAAAATALLAWALAGLVRRERIALRTAGAVFCLLFLFDAARRVAGTCPAGAPDLYARATPAVRAVKAGLANGGRFYDDGADRKDVAVRRGGEAGGFDTLRPTTGVLYGIRYALENDIDRMTPAASVDAVSRLARLPWGELKVNGLRAAGVAVVRTEATGPDPEGVTLLATSGADRIVSLGRTRPEFALLASARVVPDPSAAASALQGPSRDPAGTALVEVPGVAGALRSFGAGSVELLERSPNRQRLRVSAGEPGGLLAIARTFDPSWRATIDGLPAASFRAEGHLTALFVPKGTHLVELRYRNPLFAWGLAVSLVSAAMVLTVLAVAGGRA